MSEPGYWRTETSGRAAAAVRAYLNTTTGTGSMTIAQIQDMAAYLQQWIDAPGWKDGRNGAALRLLQLRARLIQTPADIHQWLADALDIGIDPL